MHGFDSLVMQPKFSVSSGTENSLRFERNIPLVLVWMTDGSGQFILAYPSSVHPRCLTKSTAIHGDVLA
jgi:hypothetical protein